MNKRVKFGKSFLSPYFSNIFTQFADWLATRRGIQYAATHIQNYFPFFLKLDNFALDCGEMPSYQAIVEQFTVAITRKNLLVTLYLNELGVISINESIKTDYSSLDTIERYLSRFNKKSSYSKYLNEYFNLLSAKFYSGKTSILSVRLALTPAVKLLESCKYFKLDKPTNQIIYGYLWVSPGQIASITGFINYLNTSYQLDLVIPNKEDILIYKHRSTRAQLKQQLISLLRAPNSSASYKNKVLIISLAYFHRISIPKFSHVSVNMLKKNSNDDYYVPLAGEKFYIPDECIRALI